MQFKDIRTHVMCKQNNLSPWLMLISAIKALFLSLKKHLLDVTALFRFRKENYEPCLPCISRSIKNTMRFFFSAWIRSRTCNGMSTKVRKKINSGDAHVADWWIQLLRFRNWFSSERERFENRKRKCNEFFNFRVICRVKREVFKRDL